MDYQKPRMSPLDLAVNAASCCNPTPYTPPGSCSPPSPNPPSGPSSPGNPGYGICYYFGECWWAA